jgi:hypothetical protein
MPKRESPRKRATVPKPQTREEAMTERALADFASMARTNATPIDTDLLLPEEWMQKGGSCGFSWDGIAVSGRKRG